MRWVRPRRHTNGTAGPRRRLRRPYEDPEIDEVELADWMAGTGEGTASLA